MHLTNDELRYSQALKASPSFADTPCVAMPIENRNYYDVLHVSRDAPLAIIRTSYRTLMQQMKNHPDLGGDTATAALINEAYAVLSNVDRRAEYDAELDIMARVASGVPHGPASQEPASAAERPLDATRECMFCATTHDFGAGRKIDEICGNCSSPLAIAETQRIESLGQRSILRIDKVQDITFYTQWPQSRGFTGRTEDISLNGLRFATQHELREGQRIKIVSEFLEAVANVTNCNYYRDRWKVQCVAGVSFATLRYHQSVGGFVSSRV